MNNPSTVSTSISSEGWLQTAKEIEKFYPYATGEENNKYLLRCGMESGPTRCYKCLAYTICFPFYCFFWIVVAICTCFIAVIRRIGSCCDMNFFCCVVSTKDLRRQSSKLICYDLAACRCLCCLSKTTQNYPSCPNSTINGLIFCEQSAERCAACSQEVSCALCCCRFNTYS